jgi:hypothetical protein
MALGAAYKKGDSQPTAPPAFTKFLTFDLFAVRMVPTPPDAPVARLAPSGRWDDWARATKHFARVLVFPSFFAVAASIRPAAIARGRPL